MNACVFVGGGGRAVALGFFVRQQRGDHEHLRKYSRRSPGHCKATHHKPGVTPRKKPGNGGKKKRKSKKGPSKSLEDHVSDAARKRLIPMPLPFVMNVSTTPQIGQWDDHDCDGNTDCRQVVIEKTFRQQWKGKGQEDASGGHKQSVSNGIPRQFGGIKVFHSTPELMDPGCAVYRPNPSRPEGGSNLCWLRYPFSFFSETNNGRH